MIIMITIINNKRDCERYVERYVDGKNEREIGTILRSRKSIVPEFKAELTSLS